MHPPKLVKDFTYLSVISSGSLILIVTYMIAGYIFNCTKTTPQNQDTPWPQNQNQESQKDAEKQQRKPAVYLHF